MALGGAVEDGASGEKTTIMCSTRPWDVSKIGRQTTSSVYEKGCIRDQGMLILTRPRQTWPLLADASIEVQAAQSKS